MVYSSRTRPVALVKEREMHYGSEKGKIWKPPEFIS